MVTVRQTFQMSHFQCNKLLAKWYQAVRRQRGNRLDENQRKQAITQDIEKQESHKNRRLKNNKVENSLCATEKLGTPGCRFC